MSPPRPAAVPQLYSKVGRGVKPSTSPTGGPHAVHRSSLPRSVTDRRSGLFLSSRSEEATGPLCPSHAARRRRSAKGTLCVPSTRCPKKPRGGLGIKSIVFGNHDHPAFGHGKSATVMLKIPPDGLVRGNADSLFDDAAPHTGARADTDSFKQNRILDRKSTRLNSSHIQKSRMPSSA